MIVAKCVDEIMLMNDTPLNQMVLEVNAKSKSGIKFKSFTRCGLAISYAKSL